MEGVEIEWQNIKVTVPKSDKVILDNVSGRAMAGQFLAVMGSSGAGKTTFMNVLTHRNINGLEIAGKTTLNGVNVTVGNVDKLSGYIQQEDAFVGALTVREHLLFHARLRLSKKSHAEKCDRVLQVAKILGLERALDTIIGTPGLTKNRDSKCDENIL